MTRWVAKRWVGVCTVLGGLGVPAIASAQPGAIYVSESGNGSVIDVSAGGDLSEAPRFAVGLVSPRGLCIGPGGDLYVAEVDAGQITVITDGGDFTDAEPFAYSSLGGFFPAGLLCDDDRLLVVDISGAVLEVTEAGDILTNPVLQSFGLGFGITIVEDAGSLFVSNGNIIDVSAGGDQSMTVPFATGGDTGAMVLTRGARLGASVTTPRIFSWVDGGALDEDDVWATLPSNVAGDNQVDGLVVAGATTYALSDNAVYDVTAGGDLTAAQPFATGLLGDLIGFEGMVFHVCSTDDDCSDGDACNGSETCDANDCVPGAAPDCDDEDVCTADACDDALGCTHDPVPACCTVDADCTIEEICDVANNTCVPISTGDDGSDSGGEDSGGGDESTSDPTGPDPSGPDPTDADPSAPDPSGSDDGDGESSDGTAGADAGGGDAGCGCASSPQGRSAWLLVVLAAVRRRRAR